ncbi:MAG: Hsp20/alpha crystallin family protein [Candidatus Omnitrophica bacterium]|nr:Hsp20/alpha crystallin family protein [Candidatus Omnitrophota bacterium]
MTSMFPNLFTEKAFSDMMEVLDRSPSLYHQDVSGYPVDIVEVLSEEGTVSAYEIIVALAGIKKENIDISMDGDYLTLVVKKVSESEDKTRKLIQKGISSRAMELKYKLFGIDNAGIKSSFKDGLLTIELPLREEAKVQKIVIED